MLAAKAQEVPLQPVPKKPMLAAVSEKNQPIALVLEDDDFDAAVIQELLQKFCKRSYSVKRAKSVNESVIMLSRFEFSVALVDMNVLDSKGLDTVREIIRANPHVPVIVLTGDEDIDRAVSALRLGAQDYLPKSQLDNRTLQRVIEYSKERKEKETELKSKAYFDSLTGLANRALLYERWRRSVSRAQRAGRKVGVMIADLDRFKEVNDRYGHDAGDSLLVHFADRLRHSVRETDIVARLGGDEFVIVLENIISRDDIEKVRENLTRSLPGSFSYEGREIDFTASIGGALSEPRESEELMAVIRRADAEMYECKTLAHTAQSCNEPMIVPQESVRRIAS